MDAAATRLAAAATLALASLALPARADNRAYEEVLVLEAKGRDFRVVHRHDWTRRTLDKRLEMMRTHKDPFRADDDRSYVAWYSADGKRVRQLPSPALTWLGVSPDSRYVIGLSYIRVHNPYHLVVWSRDGNLLVKRRVAPDDLWAPGFGESVTNFVIWHDFEDPAPELVETGGKPSALRIRDNRDGKVITLPLK